MAIAAALRFGKPSGGNNERLWHYCVRGDCSHLHDGYVRPRASSPWICSGLCRRVPLIKRLRFPVRRMAFRCRGSRLGSGSRSTIRGGQKAPTGKLGAPDDAPPCVKANPGGRDHHAHRRGDARRRLGCQPERACASRSPDPYGLRVVPRAPRGIPHPPLA